MNKRLRDEALQRYGAACAICGTNDMPLEVRHVIPVAAGGPAEDIDNLVVLCSSHNQSLRTPGLGVLREFDFTRYLAELLRLNPNFEDVEVERVLPGKYKRHRIDLSAREHTGQGTRDLLIECKSDYVLTEKRIDDVIAQLARYRDASSGESMVLAMPGTLTAAAVEKLKQEGVEVWDQPYLSQRFSKEIPRTHQLWFRQLLGKKPPTAPTAEERLRDELKRCAPGRDDWPVYQKLIGRTLERLFCPPLATPIPERSDFLEINRRDYILPNYAEEGYWSFLRSNYQAHFIVVDAKNYTKKVTKKEALQIANYLKSHGAGMFGLIFSRKGCDRGCDFTIRELWAVYQKLIVVLTDSDVEQMLDAKAAGRPPEDLIRQKIEDFRLSM